MATGQGLCLLARGRRSRFAFAIRRVATILFLAWTGWAVSAAENAVRSADSFNRHYLTDPAKLASILRARNLAGGTCCESGWFDYDFDVAATGWHVLLVRGGGRNLEYLVDPDEQGKALPGYRFWSSVDKRLSVQKVANLWLSAGSHTLRVQNFNWTGFSSFSGFELRRGTDSLADSYSFIAPDDVHLYRVGACPALSVLSGGQVRDMRLEVVDGPQGSQERRVRPLLLPASTTLRSQSLPLLCDGSGSYVLRFNDGEASLGGSSISEFRYEIYDPSVPAEDVQSVDDRKSIAIDCAAKAPDYSDGDSRLVDGAAGRYRESGDRGWQNRNVPAPSAGEANSGPNWFAYRLEGLRPETPYRVEVSFPDDAFRSFAIALREARPLIYPVAIGVDAGREFALSGKLQTESMIVWPRTSDPRLLFIPQHDGHRAACSSIRVVPISHWAARDQPDGLRQGYRDHLTWYEEGEHFASLFGSPGESQRDIAFAAERWAEAAAATGTSMLMPTVAVYGTASYPSLYHRTFSIRDRDVVRRILVAAERRGLKVVPELHPRADELGWGWKVGDRSPDNALISRTGTHNFVSSDGRTRNLPPYYNALNERNQQWYVEMVGELADRYRDSPAFTGISLRRMDWANPALNNLVGLDWGYEDETIARFRQETGVAVPMGRVDDVSRFAQRHAWLIANAREKWLDWRCRRIADLLSRVRDRVRRARPDLKVYLNLFSPDDRRFAPSFHGGGGTAVARLRETGIDPSMLGQIDGIVIINAYAGHGRKSLNGIYDGWRDMLLDPDVVRSLRQPGAGGLFLISAIYAEATESIVQPEMLGFPTGTKRTWMSAVFNPAGRNVLERYALALAETDAVLLGDGGNGYLFGPSLLHEFLHEFRQLPALPFADRADAVDPVTVRTREVGAELMFYAVNRERVSIPIELTLDRPARIIRAATGEAIGASSGRTVRLELKPFELIVGRTTPDARIEQVRERPSPDAVRVVASQLEWLRAVSARSRKADGRRLGLNGDDEQLLANAIEASETALHKGNIWRARTLLEHSSLLGIFRRLNCYPPGIFAGVALPSGCVDGGKGH